MVVLWKDAQEHSTQDHYLFSVTECPPSTEQVPHSTVGLSHSQALHCEVDHV